MEQFDRFILSNCPPAGVYSSYCYDADVNNNLTKVLYRETDRSKFFFIRTRTLFPLWELNGLILNACVRLLWPFWNLQNVRPLADLRPTGQVLKIALFASGLHVPTSNTRLNNSSKKRTSRFFLKLLYYALCNLKLAKTWTKKSYFGLFSDFENPKFIVVRWFFSLSIFAKNCNFPYF